MKRIALLALLALMFIGCNVPDNELKTYLVLTKAYCEGDDEAGEQLLALGYGLPDCREDE